MHLILDLDDVWFAGMFLMELELELKLESVRNWNPIPYFVWLAGNGIGIQFHILFGS